jgi:hypothetical protein
MRYIVLIAFLVSTTISVGQIVTKKIDFIVTDLERVVGGDWFIFRTASGFEIYKVDIEKQQNYMSLHYSQFTDSLTPRPSKYPPEKENEMRQLIKSKISLYKA